MKPNAAARRAWAATRLRVWPDRYAFAAFAPREAPRVLEAAARPRRAFVAVVVEAGEVTLSAPWRAFAKSGLAGRAEAVAGPYRVITFETSLALELVGYLAPAAERLARAGVSMIPQCGYRTDHLLVREQDLERAVGVLEDWIAACARPAPRPPARAAARRRR
jgi:hypothetical protein